MNADMVWLFGFLVGVVVGIACGWCLGREWEHDGEVRR